MGGQAEHGLPNLYGASPSQLPLKKKKGITSECHHLAAHSGARREEGTGGLPSTHLLDGVVADEEDSMPPRAAPHPHVGAGTEGAAQTAGGCPHHLHRDREQALSATACPGIPQPVTPGPQHRAASHQGITSRLPEVLGLDAVPIKGSALSPEGDLLLSLFCLQPVLPCKGLPCQAHFNKPQSLGHFSNLPSP